MCCNRTSGSVRSVSKGTKVPNLVGSRLASDIILTKVAWSAGSHSISNAWVVW